MYAVASDNRVEVSLSMASMVWVEPGELEIISSIPLKGSSAFFLENG